MKYFQTMIRTKKMKYTIMLKVLGFIFLMISCVDITPKDNFMGNWKSIKSEDGAKFQTEIFINDESLTVFSEEDNKLIFSRPYRLEKNEIIMIEDVVEKNEIRYKFLVTGKKLNLSWDYGSINYERISKKNTLEDYLLNKISLEEYIIAFNKRKDFMN